MARAQSQFLRIYDVAGTTYQRWQSYYSNVTVSLSGAAWIYVPFSASGITAGQTGDESGVTLTAPALPLVVDAFNLAIARAHLLELRIYQFDANNGNSSPQAGQETLATFVGEIVGMGGTLTELQIELGSALSPVGAQIPPRTFSTRLIGKGCRL